MNTATADDHVDVARVRAVHAIPDAGEVEVSAEGSSLLTFSFKDMTPFIDVQPGTLTVSVSPTGSSASISQEVTLEEGKSYTIAAVGELSEGTAQLLVLEDETEVDGSLADSTGLIRVVHAIPDAGAVDVTTSVSTTTEGVDSGVPPAIARALRALISRLQGAGRDDLPSDVRRALEVPGLLRLLRRIPRLTLTLTLFEDAEFTDVTDYRQVPAGSYEITVRSSETGGSLIVVPARIPPNRVITAFAVGYADPSNAPDDFDEDELAEVEPSVVAAVSE
jgi:hypothetical protein